MKLLSFDIEISDIFELKEGEDLEKYAPFHISVAAMAIHGGEEKLWYSYDDDGVPTTSITQQCACDLLRYLDEKQQKGFMVCAWNGLSFNLKVIGQQANDLALAARIALKSYDPMFQFFNQTGFPVGLAKVAKAMGIDQEKLMDGVDAPKEWRAGKYQEVMDYCMGDCQMTNKIILAIQEAQQVKWVTKKGIVRSKPLSELRQVEKVIKDPAPDQSWMKQPLLKEKFYKWIPKEVLTVQTEDEVPW